MANAAHGWVDFFHSDVPTPLAKLKLIFDEHPQWFAYDCEYSVENFEDRVALHFTSRWTTDPVWDLLDDLADSKDIGTWFRSVKIQGKGREDGLGHYVLVKKAPGYRVLKRQHR